MSRKFTPLLVVLVLVLGTAAFLTRQKRGGGPEAESASGARLLAISASDVQEVRVQRDFWNTFVLTRQSDGLWRLTEPTNEEAAPEAARRLVDRLANLVALETMDLPSDDSERYREYGLWQPEIELTMTTAEERHVLLVGAQAPDGESSYVTLVGSDEVHTISSAAVDVLGADLASYRPEVRLTETEEADN